MAKFRITGPDGATYEVTAPDDASEADVMAYVQQNSAKPETDTAAMVKESAIKGATNLVGAPGSVGDIIKGALNQTVGKYVVDPALEAIRGKPRSAPQEAALARGNAYGTEGLRALLRDRGVIGAPEAQPQTTGEKFLARAVEGAAGAPFGPAALAVGAGGGVGAEAGRLTAEGTKYQPLAELAGGLLGGVGTSAGINAANTAMRRLVTPFPSQLSPEQARLAQVAEQVEGIPLTAGQATGSRPLRAVEATMETMPFTAGPQRQVLQGQREAFNAAVLRRAGENANAATPDVLARAHDRLSQAFQGLSASTTVQLDQRFGQDLADVATRYARKLPSQTREVFQNYVDDIVTQGQAMPGQTYQITRSDLTKQARALTNSDPTLSNALRGLRDALDDAANRSIPAGDAAAWNEARRQYSALKTIEKAVTGAGTEAASGNISPASLRGALATADRAGYARGRGELNDLARIGETFIRPAVPNSGTPERAGIAALLASGGAGIANPAIGAMAAGGVLSPRIAQLLMNSGAGQAYLRNQLLAGPGARVSVPGAGLLGGLPQAGNIPGLLAVE